MANDNIIPATNVMLDLLNKALSNALKAQSEALKVGDKAVEGIERAFKGIKNNIEEKKFIDSDKPSEFNRTLVTQDNSAFYLSDSIESAKESAKYLKFNNIPALVIQADKEKDTKAILIVPKQYEEIADKFIKEANKILVKTEVAKSEFSKNHLEEQVIEFKGVNETQLQVIRDGLYKQPAEYCAKPDKNGLYNILTTKEDRDKIAYAYYETVLRMNGSDKDRLTEHYKFEKENDKKITDYINSGDKKKKDLVLFDYGKDKASTFRLQQDRLIEYKDNSKEGKIIATTDRNKEEYTAKVLSVTRKANVLAMGEMNSNERLSTRPDIRSHCTEKEIAKAKEEMARQDMLHGKDTAETMAHQISALMLTASEGDIQSVRSAINSSIKLSELAAWADAAEKSRFGAAEKLHRLCDDTSLDVTVMEDVLQFAIDDINYIQEAKNSGLIGEQYHTITALEAGSKALMESVQNIVVKTLDGEDINMQNMLSEFFEELNNQAPTFGEDESFEEEFNEADFSEDEYLPAGIPDGGEVK